MNLRAIRLAKVLWDSDVEANRSPNWDDLHRYLLQVGGGWITNGQPICPEGGTYIIGAMNELPRCSLGGRHTY